MKDRLLIVGAGEFGREVLGWALQVPENDRSWSVGGFLDKDLKAVEGHDLPVGVLGAPEDFELQSNDCLVVAIANPRTRKRIVDALKARGARFTSIVHPSAIFGLNNRWGDGCIFCPGVILSTNVSVGEHVIFNCQSGAGHDAVIGSYCTLSGAVDITGHVVLGEGVTLGSHACVAPRGKVGDYAVVGAGSVVLGAVEAEATVFGVPATKIWKRKSL